MSLYVLARDMPPARPPATRTNPPKRSAHIALLHIFGVWIFCSVLYFFGVSSKCRVEGDATTSSSLSSTGMWAYLSPSMSVVWVRFHTVRWFRTVPQFGSGT